MPTYTYQCTSGHEFDEFESMSSEPLKTCPMSVGPPGKPMMEESRACAAPVRRLISGGGGVIWKGGPPTKRFSGRRK